MLCCYSCTFLMMYLTQHALALPGIIVPGADAVLDGCGDVVRVHVLHRAVHSRSVVVLSGRGGPDHIPHLSKIIYIILHYIHHVIYFVIILCWWRKREWRFDIFLQGKEQNIHTTHNPILKKSQVVKMKSRATQFQNNMLLQLFWLTLIQNMKGIIF